MRSKKVSISELPHLAGYILVLTNLVRLKLLITSQTGSFVIEARDYMFEIGILSYKHGDGLCAGNKTFRKYPSSDYILDFER